MGTKRLWSLAAVTIAVACLGSSPAHAQVPPAGAGAGGCTADSDCKAGRVCRAGDCVSPPPVAAAPVAVAPVAVAPVTAATSACTADSDCKAGRVCRTGDCVSPDATPVAVVPEPTAVTVGRVGDRCNSDAKCTGALVCTDSRCQKRAAGSGLGAESRLSLYWLNGFGFAGHIQDPSPAEAVGIDFSVPLGVIRYHGDLGFENLNGYNGFRVEPLVLGVPVRVARFAGNTAIAEVEPLLSLIQVEGLASGDFSTLTLGLSEMVQGNVVWKRLVGSLGIGLEERYWSVLADSNVSRSSASAGGNFLLRFAVGMVL